MMKVGLREANWPSDEETLLLYEFVVKNYGKYTVAQIDEAFDLALARELPIKDPKCYESFSCEYIGMIMAGYQAYLINAGLMVKNTDRERQSIAFNSEKQLPHGEANWMPHFVEISQKIKSGEVPAIIPAAIYDWLCNAGKLTRDYTCFFDEARAHIKKLIGDEKLLKLKSGESVGVNALMAEFDLIESGDISARVIAQAKRFAIIYHVQNDTAMDQ